MAISKDFSAYVAELFGALAPVRIKPMFGAAGVYAHDLMFAIIADDAVWLRADAEIEDRFKEVGSEPFVYRTSDGAEMTMSYWRAPEAALEDPDEAVAWARLSLDAALRKKASKGKRVSSPTGRGRGPLRSNGKVRG